MEEASVTVIEIRTHMRYVVQVNLDHPITPQVADNIRNTIGPRLDEWWKSGQKFFVLAVDGGADVTFIRVDEGE